ncbi:hypothetical protein AK812_SmicGene20116 [Symbiodinium microadriaticum]|uniref:Uncharacterized protein n=1 Tax=Symbiodinium microadriaticum TaxID=2951 RepID=A0A1Q9DQS5_SYMMI|nr:hypothetical protein AK812_SmicGene20116 [Symbiodinium microadriaticum]
MAIWAFLGGSLLAACFVHPLRPGREVPRTTIRSESVVSPNRPRVRESWKNRVPKELISAKCHKQLRKLARGMRIGWEWELLNATQDLDGEALAKIDFEAVIHRMQSAQERPAQPTPTVHLGCAGRAKMPLELPVAQRAQYPLIKEYTFNHKVRLFRAESEMQDVETDKLKDLVEWCWKGFKVISNSSFPDLQVEQRLTTAQIGPSSGGVPQRATDLQVMALLWGGILNSIIFLGEYTLMPLSPEGLIRVGDRHGATSIKRHDGKPQPDSSVPSPEEYAAAVASQASTVWHRQAMAMALESFQAANVERLLDIGASYNPFREAFPEVVAVDPIPGHASVLEGDFLKVEIREDISEASSLQVLCWSGEQGFT